jgi:hypothetical protein
LTGVADVFVISCGGSVIVTDCVTVHPLLSVETTVYVPAVSPVAVAFVPPVGLQANVYPGFPPDVVTVAAPVASPKQSTSVCVDVAVNAVGAVIVNDCVVVQPLTSVTTQVYVPAASPLTVAPEPTLGVHA